MQTSISDSNIVLKKEDREGRLSHAEEEKCTLRDAIRFDCYVFRHSQMTCFACINVFLKIKLKR